MFKWEDSRKEDGKERERGSAWLEEPLTMYERFNVISYRSDKVT
jgi:hypothetical protein